MLHGILYPDFPDERLRLVATLVPCGIGYPHRFAVSAAARVQLVAEYDGGEAPDLPVPGFGAVVGGLPGHVERGVQHLVSDDVGDLEASLTELPRGDGDAGPVLPRACTEADDVPVGGDPDDDGKLFGESRVERPE